MPLPRRRSFFPLDVPGGTFTSAFPAIVGTDAYRRDFVSYGVSGTPTFVLIDGQGVVREYATGYQMEKGLPFAGWRWKDRPGPKP